MFSLDKTKFLAKLFVAIIAITLVIITLGNGVLFNMHPTTSKGTVKVVGSIPLLVYADDKITLLSEIDWGVINLDYKSFRLWLNCPSAQTTSVVIYWNVNSFPSYLNLNAIRESSTNFWTEWKQNASIVFPKSGWLHIEYKLKALEGAPLGSFQYNTIIWIAA